MPAGLGVSSPGIVVVRRKCGMAVALGGIGEGLLVVLRNDVVFGGTFEANGWLVVASP